MPTANTILDAHTTPGLQRPPLVRRFLEHTGSPIVGGFTEATAGIERPRPKHQTPPEGWPLGTRGLAKMKAPARANRRGHGTTEVTAVREQPACAGCGCGISRGCRWCERCVEVSKEILVAEAPPSDVSETVIEVRETHGSGTTKGHARWTRKVVSVDTGPWRFNIKL